MICAQEGHTGSLGFTWASQFLCSELSDFIWTFLFLDYIWDWAESDLKCTESSVRPQVTKILFQEGQIREKMGSSESKESGTPPPGTLANHLYKNYGPRPVSVWTLLEIILITVATVGNF